MPINFLFFVVSFISKESDEETENSNQTNVPEITSQPPRKKHKSDPNVSVVYGGASPVY